jgi:hypothetical protein
MASVLVHNEVDEEGRWVAMKLEKGSWVNLRTSRRGPWRHMDTNPFGNAESMNGIWKAQVVDFRFSVGNNVYHSTTSSPPLEAVLVRHAYTKSQIQVDLALGVHAASPCNYVFPSFDEDWVSPRSIVTVIVAMHYEIGEETQGARTYAELRENGIYFYRYTYVRPTTCQLWGTLEDIPLTNLDDPDWQLPDMSTSEAFRAKLRTDFQRCTKVTTGSRMGHLQWFVPIHVLIDLIGVSKNVRRTPTLLKISDPEDALFDSMMDPSWDEKVVVGRDILKCKIIRSTVQLCYHIVRQILYANFKYQRLRLVRRSGDTVWELLDQAPEEEMVWITCMYEGREVGRFEVGKTWPLTHIRQEVCITMGNTTPEEFKLWIQRPGQADVKVSSLSSDPVSKECLVPVLRLSMLNIVGPKLVLYLFVFL